MIDLQTLIQNPLSYDFMQRAILAAVIVGIVSGVVGSFVVVRGMSFFGDALAHSILPGVSAAYIYSGGAAFSMPLLSEIQDESLRLFVGGLAAGIFAAVLIGWLTRDKRLKEDTVIGIVFVAMFALGIAIISSDPRAYGRDLVHILFGNILGISNTDIWIMVVCGVVVIGIVVFFFKELVVISFDVGLARTLQLPTEGLRILLLVLIAVTIVASLQIVGITLMLAMLIAPAAIAQLVTKRMHHMIIVAAVVGAVSGVVGVFISYHLGIATGPAIVLTVTTLFLIAFSMTYISERFSPAH
ncbi:MAG: metal ABC transporter permease [Aggregatilineales bacterium]